MVDATHVDRIIELACRAPSVHNSQPWAWVVHGDRVDLHADLSRRLVHADPDGRDLVISCGAALHHFQEAARALGWHAHVCRTPDPDEPAWLATIQLSADSTPPDAQSILTVIGQRRTDRRRLTSWPVPRDRLVALAAMGSRWGAQVFPVHEEAAKSRLTRLTLQAEAMQRRQPGYLGELEASLTQWADHGVPTSHVPQAATLEAPDVSRRFGDGLLHDPPIEQEPPSEGMLLVTTSSDDILSRVRAGETMSAMWLRATLSNLAVVPLSQAIEVDETRRVLCEDVLTGLACPQVILRVGWPPLSNSQLPPTPRRHIDQVRSSV